MICPTLQKLGADRTTSVHTGHTNNSSSFEVNDSSFRLLSRFESLVSSHLFFFDGDSELVSETLGPFPASGERGAGVTTFSVTEIFLLRGLGASESLVPSFKSQTNEEAIATISFQQKRSCYCKIRLGN